MLLIFVSLDSIVLIAMLSLVTYISQIIPNVVISPVQYFVTGMYRDCE